MSHEFDCNTIVNPAEYPPHCEKCHCTCGQVTHVGEVGHPEGCPGCVEDTL